MECLCCGDAQGHRALSLDIFRGVPFHYVVGVEKQPVCKHLLICIPCTFFALVSDAFKANYYVNSSLQIGSLG